MVTLEQGEIDLQPRILIPPDDDTRSIHIREEDGRLR